MAQSIREFAGAPHNEPSRRNFERRRQAVPVEIDNRREERRENSPGVRGLIAALFDAR
jgi:hypothetical protein